MAKFQWTGGKTQASDPYSMEERRLIIQALILLSQSEGWPVEARNDAVRLVVRITTQPVVRDVV